MGSMGLFSKPQATITVTTETIVKSILVAVLVFVFLRFVGSVGHQLRLIGISLFLALALNPAVTWLTLRLKSKSRTRATGVAYVTVIVVLGSFLALVVPPLVRQTSDFVHDVPRIINDFRTQDSAVARTARRYNLDEQLDSLSQDFSSRINRDFSKPVFTTANRILGTLVSIITVFVLTFMMLIEGPVWFARILALQPAAKRAHRKQIARRMYRVVTGYVNGQVLIAAIAAAFAMVVLLIGSSLADVSVNAVALAGIIFLFGLIPLIGNTLGAAIVVLVCLFSSAPLAIGMAVYFLVYQQVENATLQPMIQARANQLTPLIVFTAALLGAGLGGLLGAFAAIPIAGCLRILLEERYKSLFPTMQSVEQKQEHER